MQQLAYRIYNDITGQLVANLYLDSDTNVYSAELLQRSTSVPVMFLDLLHGGFDPSPSSQAIEAFLKSRVLPPNRQNIQQLLEQEGMHEYNWKEMIKLNQGRSVEDYFSVRAVI